MARMQIVRFSKENPNWEKGLEGKWGYVGESWGCVTCIKNLLMVVAYRGAKVGDYKLPEVYDGFLMCSDGSIVQVNDSTINLSLGADVSAQGMLKLKKDN